LKRNCHLFAPLSLVTVYLLELPEIFSSTIKHSLFQGKAIKP
jgi:hypothetical protein